MDKALLCLQIDFSMINLIEFLKIINCYWLIIITLLSELTYKWIVS